MNKMMILVALFQVGSAIEAFLRHNPKMGVIFLCASIMSAVSATIK